jgi:hypothetical protein
MTNESTLKIKASFHNDLKMLNDLAYSKCDLSFSNLKWNPESTEYGACSFELNGKIIQYRASKITPTKVGQFVTTWKRNEAGKTMPFDFSDPIDFIIITARDGNKIGQFFFSKAVLADHGIITRNSKAGKCGIRVYPPWDAAVNKQAKATQARQIKYFIEIKTDRSTDLSLLRKLFSEEESK